MNRDELIEKGRQILVSIYGEQLADERAVVRSMLAVFEQAHTPTDDEVSHD